MVVFRTTDLRLMIFYVEEFGGCGLGQMGFVLICESTLCIYDVLMIRHVIVR